MLKAVALPERFVNIGRQHLVHPLMDGLKQNIHRVTRTTRAEKPLDGVQVWVVHRLVKELDELR